MRAWLMLVVLVLIGCAPNREAATSRSAIIGGTPTGANDPEVFALYDGAGFFCSSTLIHPRVLLTAAHCVENGVTWVGNAPNGPADFSIRVERTWENPDYRLTGVPEDDVGLVLLSPAITTVTPRPFDHGEVPMAIGVEARAIGYGMQAGYFGGVPPPPSGERRTVDLTVTGVRRGVIEMGQPGAAVCFGDSGGPLLARNDAGVETVVGVHSYTNDSSCGGGGAMRVAPLAARLDAWIAANAVPSCDVDGACVQNCPGVDLDCVCVSDGQCTAECARPSLDPDCPRECDVDGVCATVACPLRDPDCRDVGATCFSDQQCGLAGRCVGDPQHAGFYCSRRCTNDAECIALNSEFECGFGVCRYRQVPERPLGAPCTFGDRCEGNAQCHLNAPNVTVCAQPCTQNAECPDAFECRLGSATWRACIRTPTPVTLPRLSSSFPADTGCSSAVAGPMVLLLVALQRRRRARSRTASAASPPAPVEQPPRTMSSPSGSD